jgi:glucose/mannose-6-phosphate isomerase
MSWLDQPENLAGAGSRIMADLLSSFPGQLRGAARTSPGLSLPPPDSIHNVIVTGMGGSAIGGDVARAAVLDDARVPIFVNRDYLLPAFAGRASLVIASSYSGNTEETLQAYSAARRMGSSVACITSGGRLAAMARADCQPLLLIPGGLPPRAALGHSVAAILSVLQSAGLVKDVGAPLKEAADLLEGLALRYGADTPEERNPAKTIARLLHGRVVAVYASGRILEAAAYRWRCQIEENAKNLALHHTLPEMNHNELVGWEWPAEQLKGIGVVFLRDRRDHAHTQRRFELTRDIVGQRCGVTHEVWTEGESALARILSVIHLGDWASYYMACLNRVDPTAIAAIDYLKRELGSY